jgi:hypothetical protein
MGDEDVAWIRANVWTQAMRKEHQSVPDFARTCPCQGGKTGWCQRGTARSCARCVGVVVVSPETYVTDKRGYVLSFEGGVDAEVWLADRACRWRCPCECHSTPVPEPVQLTLFDLATVGVG